MQTHNRDKLKENICLLINKTGNLELSHAKRKLSGSTYCYKDCYQFMRYCPEGLDPSYLVMPHKGKLSRTIVWK